MIIIKFLFLLSLLIILAGCHSKNGYNLEDREHCSFPGSLVDKMQKSNCIYHLTAEGVDPQKKEFKGHVSQYTLVENAKDKEPGENRDYSNYPKTPYTFTTDDVSGIEIGKDYYFHKKPGDMRWNFLNRGKGI